MSDVRPANPSVPDYRLYIDESGDHTYHKVDQPWHGHLALLGLWFRCRPDYEEFSDSLTAMKRRVFGLSPDDRLVLHRTDIKGRKGRFGVLRDPAVDRAFCDELLRVIERATFVMAIAILDKRAHQESSLPPEHPYHRSLQAVMENYAFWLAERGGKGDAMIEARGRTEDKALQAVHYHVTTAGTTQLKPATAERVFTSTDLKFRTKEHAVDGLQLADLLVHPVKRKALLEAGEEFERRGGFAEELASVAWGKFRTTRSNTPAGCGLKLI